MVSIVLKKPQEFHTNDSNPNQRGRRGGGPIIIFHRKILFSTTVHPVDLRPVCKLKFVSFGPGEKKTEHSFCSEKVASQSHQGPHICIPRAKSLGQVGVGKVKMFWNCEWY